MNPEMVSSIGPAVAAGTILAAGGAAIAHTSEVNLDKEFTGLAQIALANPKITPDLQAKAESLLHHQNVFPLSVSGINSTNNAYLQYRLQVASELIKEAQNLDIIA